MSEALPLRSPGVLVFLVFLATLGVLGMCAGGVGVASGIWSQGAASMMTAGMHPSQARAYEDLMAASAGMTMVQTGVSTLRIVTAMSLLAGAVLGLLQRGPWKIPVTLGLIGGFFIALVEMVMGVVNYALIDKPMAEYVRATVGSELQGVESIIGASMIAGLAVGLLWFALKLVFFLASLWFVQRKVGEQG